MACVIEFRCEACQTDHESREEALDCCPPVVTEVYLCRRCREEYTSIASAEQCCPETPAEIQAAAEAEGQQRLF